MNNFEKIKAMDIDEMAEFIDDMYFSCVECDCVNCLDIVQDFCEQNSVIETKNGIKQWLESEVRE
jgi:hypothetical protein